MIFKNISKTKFIFTLMTCFIISSLFAQKNSKIWDALLTNDRSMALELVNKTDFENDIESLILKKIIEMENGIIKADPDFVKKISKYPDYSNYLFSNWTLPHFFSDYHSNGFDSNSYKIPHLIDASRITNSTVRSGLYYLQAVTKRHQREWKDYSKIINKINTVTDWEYCGVFENLNSSGIQMPYEPEEEVSSEKVFNAQSKGNTQWYRPTDDEDIYNFFTNHSEYSSGVHYAQSFIYSPTSQRVHLKLGKGGLTRLWLNDVLIVEDDNTYKTELDAYTYAVNLHKGVNRILIKLATGKGETPYFILRIEDSYGKPFTDYSFSFDDKKYKESSLDEVAPKLIPHSVESFFKKKLQDPQSDTNVNNFCLYLTYYRNGKLEEGLELLNNWLKNYPNSSFLKSCLIYIYEHIGDESSQNKLQENIKLNDPDYYLSSILKMDDIDALLELDLEDFKTELNKVKNSIDHPLVDKSVDFFILFRENNRELMRQKLDELLDDEATHSSIKNTFSEFYSTFFNDDNATIEALEKFNKEEYNWECIQYLAYYYKKQNRIKDAIELYEKSLKRFNNDNNVHYKLVTLLHDTGQYERSLPYVDMALENYPNSFVFTKFKADAYVQLNKRDEAAELYELALTRSPSNQKIRTLINDLRKEKNPLNQFHIKNAYNYIKEKRDVISNNNYGINVLLSQSDILAYENGGGEYKNTFIYEITSQNGIDIFKEYSLGLSGNYIIHKSEIVKADETVIPADKNGSDLVFDNLEIGDVIHIDYEAKYSSTGRFYKDYILNHNFIGYHPTVKNIYRLVTFDEKVNYKLTNGDVDYNSYKNGKFYIHEWSLNDSKGLQIQEDYMPTYNDISTRLHISSIDDWDEISNWYSDLVKKELKYDQVVQETYTTIFPNGYKNLSETERAQRIYQYITTLNYSHVSFRQSGYIPQKPSKTINTKLGDCKDFSSLFLVLAKQVDLEVKMVLVLTSDYGRNHLVLPSTNFNHCIVKVNIDGDDQFLELTNKYLPFGTIPGSLRNATLLEIPLDSSNKSKSNLTYLDNFTGESSFHSDYVIDINGEESRTILTTSISGSVGSYYIEKFKSEEGELLKETLLKDISDRSNKVVKSIEINSSEYDKDKGRLDFQTSHIIDINESQVANMMTFKVPFFLNPYNNSIIKNDNRSFPIDYKKYENTDFYTENMLIRLKSGKEFIDIPENQSFKFKEHNFSISYFLKSKDVLNIKVKSQVSFKTITPKEYSEFKSFVENVLNTRQVLIKYKI